MNVSVYSSVTKNASPKKFILIDSSQRDTCDAFIRVILSRSSAKLRALQGGAKTWVNFGRGILRGGLEFSYEGPDSQNLALLLYVYSIGTENLHRGTA